ncbi:triosephosphate isomerase [Actinorhabdospora filicis]|uniref:Triosephosphate isomerase n=1 Tax=Actinorhabdospora filicis TaxID=1785913 RepID=A0A9W6WAU2_9ACTN|nr:triose-phosphate isomerase [Actinorhabdospora filicis]GLZ78936.1 triosephosphate isomerase [Actinorhabdospora filicis]
MTGPRRPLIAGNWKMNLNHFEAIALVQKLAFSLDEKQLSDVEVVVLPPFTDLRSVQTLVDGDKLLIGYGAQDISEHASGAYTGEIAGSMLAKLGCTYVVIGHSERREYHHEDDALVNRKIKAALKVEVTPIVCVGEKLEVREAAGHLEHCFNQLDGALDGLKAEEIARLVIAYEPVWAIGTGRTATPEDAQEVIGALRERLAERHGKEVAQTVRVLYGGSVKSANIAMIMAKKDVDGALVGGASLDGDEFAALCRFPEHAKLG